MLWARYVYLRQNLDLSFPISSNIYLSEEGGTERYLSFVLVICFKRTLVPQDPTDEPADVFLERIRTGREAKSGSVRPKR